MKVGHVLVIDDDILIADFIAETLKQKGITVFLAKSGAQGLEILKEEPVDLILTDMKMPKMSGLEFIKKCKESHPHLPIIVITGYGTIDNAVEAMRLGCYNYLLKPFTPDTLDALVDKASEYVGLIAENRYLREKQQNEKVIGESALFKGLLQTVSRIAESNASVFIHGESGTGKEVIASLIHSESNRAAKPFIKVNCAAIPDTLIESEFFGHEKGAFTGAASQRKGRFELAHGGSLLLDEISEIPPSLQAKLLRITQEQEFERIGGAKPIHVDVRLISTSNRNIKEMLAQKVLREDLFYRLNVIPIYVPPLRERRDDIIPLSEYFLKTFCEENHKKLKTLSPSAKEKLLAYDWPGNVRELANIMERAVVIMDDKIQITPDQIYLDQTKSLRDLEKQQIVESLYSKEK